MVQYLLNSFRHELEQSRLTVDSFIIKQVSNQFELFAIVEGEHMFIDNSVNRKDLENLKKDLEKC